MTHPVDMQEHFPDLVKSACVMQAGHSLFDGPDARSRGNQAARATLWVRASVKICARAAASIVLLSDMRISFAHTNDLFDSSLQPAKLC